MKKTKKEWRAHFDGEDNWIVVKKEPKFGIQITNLVGTEIYALEAWYEPVEIQKRYGATGHWMQKFYFYLEENEEHQLYPVDDYKTDLINRLYKGELQCD